MKTPDLVSPSTRKAYSSSLARWHAWCGQRGVTALPATPQTLREYLVHLQKENVSSSAIQTTVAAVHDAHLYAAEPSPTDDPVIRRVIAGLLRTRG